MPSSLSDFSARLRRSLLPAPFPRPWQALLLLGLALATSASGQVSTFDRTFQADVTLANGARADGRTVFLPDGRILVFGSFEAVHGVPRRQLARLQADGSLDTSFDTQTNNGAAVSGVSVLPDGRVYAYGFFSSVGTPATTQRLIVRLLPSGAIDPTFNSSVDLIPVGTFGPTVTSVVPQPDGKVLIAGAFVSVGGVSNLYLARLNADGSRDASFTPPTLGTRQPAITLLPDGRILLSGSVSTVDGVARRIARLNADGSFDASFNPGLNGAVSWLLRQPDGKLFVVGSFSTVDGVPRAGLARLHADGTLDPSAYANATGLGSVSSLLVQEDDSVLSDDFSSATLTRRRFDGSLDPSFRVFSPQPSTATFIAVSLAGYADGRILSSFRYDPIVTPQLARPFSTQVSRIFNDPADASLAVVSAQRVRWIRRGSVQTTNSVVFQWSADGQTGWADLGDASWLGAGVWELSGLNLPASGHVRGLARHEAGQSPYRQGWSGLTVPYHLHAPILSVESATGAALANNATVTLGSADPGRAVATSFQLRNRGSQPLTGVTATLSGSGASHFAVSASPASTVPGPGGVTTVEVRFAPLSAGAKAAALTIASNDPQQPTFVVSLTGTGSTVGANDPAFLPGVVQFQTSPPEAPGAVETLVSTVGNRLFLGGTFDALGLLERDHVGRLLPNGTVDGAFYSLANGRVTSLAALDDGSLVLGGAFTQLNGVARNGLGRYLADATVDAGFDPGLGAAAHILPLADGKFLVADQAGTFLRRLQPGGAVDATYLPPALTGENVVLLPQPDGRVVRAAGTFANNRWTTQIQRLEASGALDATFTAAPLTASVTALALQRDGRIVVGGLSYPGPTGLQPFLARLNADGSADPTLVLTGTGTTVYALAVQADGKLLVGGLFSDFVGPAANIVRLLPDGTRDVSFAGTADEAVLTLLNGPDGDVFFGGQFSASLTRVPQPTPTHALSALGATGVQWLRGGSAPELQQVRFDLSTDQGATWTSLGAGVPIAGGWALGSLQLPAGGLLRARGRSHTTGFFHGHSSLVETVAGFGLSQLAAWRALQGLPADGSQDLANPSGDGLPNLLKFAFGLAPNAGDLARATTGGTPSVGIDAQGRPTFTFPRLRSSANAGIAYTLETSSDLALWSPVDLGAATSTPLNAFWETVTVTDPVPTRARFGRVRITRTP